MILGCLIPLQIYSCPHQLNSPFIYLSLTLLFYLAEAPDVCPQNCEQMFLPLTLSRKFKPHHTTSVSLLSTLKILSIIPPTSKWCTSPLPFSKVRFLICDLLAYRPVLEPSSLPFPVCMISTEFFFQVHSPIQDLPFYKRKSFSPAINHAITLSPSFLPHEIS